MTENPHAFPQRLTADGPFGGTTLRDYFAGQALAGATTEMHIGALSDEEISFECAALASLLYRLADAMLAERAKVQS